MQTVEMPKGTPVGFEEILTDIQRLDNQSLVAFAIEINRLVAHRNNGQYFLKADRRTIGHFYGLHILIF